jgi:hypothetical protein
MIRSDNDGLSSRRVYRQLFGISRWILPAALLVLALGGGIIACSDGDGPYYGDDPWPETAVQAIYDLDAADTDFYALPFPSDLLLDAQGQPDLGTFPNVNNNPFMNDVIEMAAQERTGWGLNQVCLFAFDGNLGVASLPEEGAASSREDSLVWFTAVDPDSPDYGRLLPVRHHYWTKPDPYQPGKILSVAPYQGVTLRQDTTYACILWRGIADDQGGLISPNESFRRVVAGNSDNAEEARAAALYAPLRDFLAVRGRSVGDVLAATVFTTWHPATRFKEIFDQALATYDTTLVTPFAQTREYPDYLVLSGELEMPQFQAGTQPFDTEGTLVFDAAGNLVQQGNMIAPVVLTLPKSPMPAEGYPLCVFIHGSGGLSTQAVDRGPQTHDHGPVAGEGPAMHLAQLGIASVCMGMPLNPERLPGASDLAYLNYQNFPAMRGTFRQGTIELGLMFRLLRAFELDGAQFPGLSPSGGSIRFDQENLFAMGQSMGAMYVNLWGPFEPSLKVLVPTGAGGQYTLMLMHMTLMPAGSLINILFGIGNPDLDDLHPTMVIGQLALDTVDPIVTMPHLFRYPFEGIPAKSVFHPAGYVDSYFGPPVISAVALSMGLELAGDLVYPKLEEELAMVGLRHLDYPVEGNVAAGDGTTVTGVIAQYAADDVTGSGHYVAFQLDEPKYQYRCFFKSYLETGRATVYAPAAVGPPCP